MVYYTQTVDETLHGLDSNIAGLSAIEAEERLAHYGPNSIRVRSEPWWVKAIEPFRSVFMAVLVVAIVISLLHHAIVDAIIIGLIITVSAGIYYVQRFSTERVLRSLQKHRAIYVSVRRKSETRLLEASALVPGDIIYLEEGDKVPADARLMEVASLRVDESQLTGESLPISKETVALHGEKEVYEQSNMIFQGSFVVGGSATAIVTTTGNDTEFGKIADLSSEVGVDSPVRKKIDGLITKLIGIVAAVAIVAFALSLYRGIEVTEALRFVIALSVSAVPEGLPIAITVILVLGMRRMAARRALVRTMGAIESIGTITTIATDKTGTLTKNKLTVRELWHPSGSHDRVARTLAAATIPPRHSTTVHDPLDIAFQEYIAAHHENASPTPNHVYEFEHELSMSGTLHHHGSAYMLSVKGAPERILEKSDLTENEREKAIIQLHHMTGMGYRVLALAHTQLSHNLSSLHSLPNKHRLTFDGFVAVADVLRPEARTAIATAQRAGITIRMITGDHFETAFHIAKQLGLISGRDQVFDSRRMSHMSDDELSLELDNVRVFSRVAPEHKHRILAILKRDNITAMTGDGVNDVPALTNAHVGIAMGSGAQIAKDAGDIILLDNNFRSIITAVREGRIVYANIKRMVVYLLATSLGEVVVSIGSLLIGLPLPLAPVQILWINLVTDTCMVIPLGLEPGERHTMTSPPRPAAAPLLTRFMIGRILVAAGIMAILTLYLYSTYAANQGHDYARTIAFSALVTMQWANAFVARSDREPLWQRLAKPNPAFYVGLIAAVSMQTIAVFGPLSSLLHVTTIALGDLAYVSLVSFIIPIIVLEMYKWLGRQYAHKAASSTINYDR
ncbi:cation-transporting P-type ATPase [Candidatus Saccharibacteria bacterium]|nr:MAG: cation-transporting P-type ATPase [Candidatus Saccharibacteria bacterium]